MPCEAKNTISSGEVERGTLRLLVSSLCPPSPTLPTNQIRRRLPPAVPPPSIALTVARSGVVKQALATWLPIRRIDPRALGDCHRRRSLSTFFLASDRSLPVSVPFWSFVAVAVRIRTHTPCLATRRSVRLRFGERRLGPVEQLIRTGQRKYTLGWCRKSRRQSLPARRRRWGLLLPLLHSHVGDRSIGGPRDYAPETE
jgi:hypothetical protein